MIIFFLYLKIFKTKMACTYIHNMQTTYTEEQLQQFTQTETSH